jgi:hypothetical protein
MPMKSAITLAMTLATVACLVLVASAVAQIYPYPEKGQSTERQAQDRTECSQWATQQTGAGPTQAQASPPTAPPPPGGGVVRGGARGAAVGAVGGAIGGDAGKGAAIGAATGALFGGMKRRSEAQGAAQQQSAPAQAGAQTTSEYDRALAACLTGRGYTVK